MRKKVLVVALCGLAFVACAQTDGMDHRNFPIIISLQFHSLSLPFQHLLSNFSNIGIGLGTEISLNGKDNFVQQVTAVWYRNKAVGNGLLFYSQVAWRPTFTPSSLYSELKAGAGYLIASRPTKSFKPVNGEWVSVGHRGKGMFTIPIGVTVGYNKYSPQSYISPFVSYQFLILSGYNKSVPIIPETLIQVGTRIHP